MSVKSIAWVARLVDDRTFEEARDFGRHLGLAALVDEPGKLMLVTPGGDVLEYCTSSADGVAEIFDGQDTAVGFSVGDIDTAITSLAEGGFVAVGQAQLQGGVTFRRVIGPGGRPYSIIQLPRS